MKLRDFKFSLSLFVHAVYFSLHLRKKKEQESEEDQRPVDLGSNLDTVIEEPEGI